MKRIKNFLAGCLSIVVAVPVLTWLFVRLFIGYLFGDDDNNFPSG